MKTLFLPFAGAAISTFMVALFMSANANPKSILFQNAVVNAVTAVALFIIEPTTKNKGDK